MKNWLLLLFALPLLVFSCRKDTDITLTTTDYNPPVLHVTSSLSGQVVGPDAAPISGAIVRLGNEATTTNAQGLYQFQNVRMNARGTYVTAHKAGYFHGSDRFYPANGSRNSSTIELLPKTVVGTLNASQGGRVDVANGASITFPANAVANAAGIAYTGEVRVLAQWLNPTADNLGEIMPGGLVGVRTDGSEALMASMGMLAVELEDAAGNALQVAGSKKVTLRLPVPAELRAQAPAEIPLWYFDEIAGVWIEDGKATLEGDTYTGEVSHFTYWNLDIPTTGPLVMARGCVVDAAGNPVTFRYFNVIDPTSGLRYGGGMTDGAGTFGGLMPAGTTLNIVLIDACGNFITFPFGPFDSDTDVTNCFTVSALQNTTLSGRLVNCDGVGVDGGVVYVNPSNSYTRVATTDADGQFSISFNNCSTATEVSLTGYDLANNGSSETSEYTLSEDLNIGDIAFCDNPIAEYINFEMDGGNFISFLEPVLGRGDSAGLVMYQLVAGMDNTSTGYSNIAISFLSLDVGMYSGDGLTFQCNFQSGGRVELGCWSPCTSVVLTISESGTPGEYLEGSFSGTSNGAHWASPFSQLTDVPVSGTFRVRIPE